MIKFTPACRKAHVSHTTALPWREIYPEFFVCNDDGWYDESIIEVIKTVSACRKAKESDDTIRRILGSIMSPVYDTSNTFITPQSNEIVNQDEAKSIYQSIAIIADQKAVIEKLNSMFVSAANKLQDIEDNAMNTQEELEQTKVALDETVTALDDLELKFSRFVEEQKLINEEKPKKKGWFGW